MSSYPTIFIMITVQFVEWIVNLIGLLLFGLIYYNHLIMVKFKDYFKQLPVLNRVIVTWFTVCFSISNKIYVNNNVSKPIVSCFTFLLLVISHIFFPCIVLWVIFWIIVLESWFFAIVYTNFSSVRNFINDKLFKGNDAFAKEYFRFFWGDMTSGGAGKGLAGFVGTVLGGLYHIARNMEKKYVQDKGGIEAQKLIDNGEIKLKTPSDCLEFQQQVNQKIIVEETVILKGEQQVTEFFKKILEVLFN